MDSNRDETLMLLTEWLLRQGASVNRADDGLSASFGSALGYRFWGRFLPADQLPINLRVVLVPNEESHRAANARTRVNLELASREGFYLLNGPTNKRILSNRIDEILSSIERELGSVTK